MRGEGVVAGEGSVVGVPKFHWSKCTMPLTNINSDWMSNSSSDLCINLVILYYLYYADPLIQGVTCLRTLIFSVTCEVNTTV